MPRPLYDEEKFNLAKGKLKGKQLDGFLKFGGDSSRYFCNREHPPHGEGAKCKKKGYSSRNYAKRHILDSHYTDTGSLRQYNCIVCKYRGIQLKDFKEHMKKNHPECIRIHCKRPEKWDRLYNRYKHVNNPGLAAVDDDEDEEEEDDKEDQVEENMHGEEEEDEVSMDVKGNQTEPLDLSKPSRRNNDSTQPTNQCE